MMNSISRPMAFALAAATIAATTLAASSASAQQAATEVVVLSPCNNRPAARSSHADDGNKRSALGADSTADKPAGLAMSKEGLVRRTSVSVLSVAPIDSGEITEELSSQPRACHAPAAAPAPRKVVDR